jgi:4-amino-4-deoxychorismate lyase
VTVLIDGKPVDAGAASIPVFDALVLRGDGCFEAIRAYRGVPFQLEAHLARLEVSASMLEVPLPSDIAGWVRTIAEEGGDCIVRVLVSRGGDVDSPEGPTRVIVLSMPVPPQPEEPSLAIVPAPWHSAGASWDLMGAKTLSYAPNMAAVRAARRRGFDDAVLVDRDGVVLEGPTFSVAWMWDGVLETPALDLGILDSITRRVLIEEAKVVGVDVVEGRWATDRLLAADEALAFSTVREVSAVRRIEDRRYPSGPVVTGLVEAFATRVRGEVG